MAEETIDQMLARLERERDELTVTINTLRRYKGLPPVADAPAPATPAAPAGPSANGAMRSDEFFGMSIIAAAKKYLSMTRQPTRAPVIAKQLKAHGLLNESKGFSGTVYSLLYRESEKADATVIKLPGNEWALREWYPHMRRQRGKSGDGDADTEPTPDEQPTEPEQPS